MLEISDDIRALPVPVVIDHIGWPDLSLGVDEPGFQMLRSLLAEAHVWVKLSGAYRLCDPPYERADAAIRTLVTANPDQCLWASDWPHLMLADATLPDADVLLNRFLEVVPESVPPTGNFHRQSCAFIRVFLNRSARCDLRTGLQTCAHWASLG